MNRSSEAKIQKEIRERAFQRLDKLGQEKQKTQRTQDTLCALREVTGLPRLELETIAREVRRSYDDPNENFFSIKHQFFLASGIFGGIIFFIWLLR